MAEQPQMTLEDFVSDTLQQVNLGVRRAQHDSKGNSAGIINPNEGFAKIEFIDFDVAVTTIAGTESRGGIGVFVGPVGLGSQGASEASNSSINRIKFKIPVLYPVGPAEPSREEMRDMRRSPA